MSKIVEFLKKPAVSHTLAALAPVVATLLASLVTSYPVLGSVLRAVCPK